MNQTFTTARQPPQPLTEADLREVLGLIKEKNQPRDWSLISPEGTLYKGQPMSLAAILIKARGAA